LIWLKDLFSDDLGGLGNQLGIGGGEILQAILQTVSMNAATQPPHRLRAW
jgi:hypothetical protein